MKVLVATKNPAKIQGATEAFEKYFDNLEVVGIPMPSDVPEQPVNNDTYLGAQNRAMHLFEHAKQNNIDADYFVAIESGIANTLGNWMIVNVGIVIDKNGKQSWGLGPAFPVPHKFVDKIIETDLGTVMDDIFNENDLRSHKGGINFLTDGVISRIDITREAFVMALTQFTNQYWHD